MYSFKHMVEKRNWAPLFLEYLVENTIIDYLWTKNEGLLFYENQINKVDEICMSLNNYKFLDNFIAWKQEFYS